MRKIAQYRRNQHPNSGFSEKLAWQLSKGPATGRELSARFGISLSEFNRLIGNIILRGGKTMQITVSDVVRLKHGSIDRTYTLARKVRRVAPGKMTPIVINQSRDASEEARQIAVEAAKRRARLIASGIYTECMG